MRVRRIRRAPIRAPANAATASTTARPAPIAPRRARRATAFNRVPAPPARCSARKAAARKRARAGRAPWVAPKATAHRRAATRHARLSSAPKAIARRTAPAAHAPWIARAAAVSSPATALRRARSPTAWVTVRWRATELPTVRAPARGARRLPDERQFRPSSRAGRSPNALGPLDSDTPGVEKANDGSTARGGLRVRTSSFREIEALDGPRQFQSRLRLFASPGDAGETRPLRRHSCRGQTVRQGHLGARSTVQRSASLSFGCCAKRRCSRALRCRSKGDSSKSFGYFSAAAHRGPGVAQNLARALGIPHRRLVADFDLTRRCGACVRAAPDGVVR